MSKRNYIVKARISKSEFDCVRKSADTAGISQSEFLRLAISRTSEALDLQNVLLLIEQKLASLSSVDMSNSIESASMETLLLLRELVAERNPQILARVSQKLDTHFGVGRGRV